MAEPTLAMRPAESCRWDCVALGEVMLRFDPGPGRVRTARSFQVWEGGGEYNVARALRKVFGLRTGVVTALPNNELGRLAEDLIAQGGVDMRHVIRRPVDGLGGARMGLNFTERGYGVRSALGVSDRANSAASRMRPGEADWERLFGGEGVRWFHTGGVFAALSPETAETVIEAIGAAKEHGAVVSYDMNFRPSLWADRGGRAGAAALSRRVAARVDVMIGGMDDFTTGLGLEPPGEAGEAGLRRAMEAAARAFPNLRVIAATQRTVTSASRNDWSAILWADGRCHESARRDDLEIFDRVGGGDAFASGLAFAFLEGLGPQAAVDYGAAHGALAMTTPGDTSMADRREVEALVRGAGAGVVR